MGFFQVLQGVSTEYWSERLQRLCLRDGCKFTAASPASGELLQTDNFKRLHYILRTHLHFMFDEDKGEQGYFVIGDRFGNVYFYVWDNGVRYVCRVMKRECKIAPFMFEYTIRKVRG